MRITSFSTSLALTGLLLASPLVAQQVYVCKSDTDDTTLFSDLPCGEAQQGGAIGTISGMDFSGMDSPPSAARAAPAARATREAAPPSRPQQSRPGRLSFGERAELRGLEIERDGLERDLRKRHMSDAARSRARQRLTQVNREISALERRQP
ncbi:MAG: DUF4124 domain-containing protein [Alcanivorax sp.]|nr:DUF4124 domain-containing protein [Alcanivorax sp.]